MARAEIRPDEPVDLSYLVADLEARVEKLERQRNNALANYHRDPARRGLWRDAVLTAHRSYQRTETQLAHTRRQLRSEG